MLRAMFVTGSLSLGGAERHAITLMNRLTERRHECHAVYVKRDADQLDRILLGDGGTIRCLNATRYLDLRAVAEFAAHIRRIRPSVIVAANPYVLMYSTLALHRSRLRAARVVTFHTTRLFGAKERVKMLFERPFFWSADRAIFLCEKQRSYWLRRGVFSRRNEVIHNGIDADHFCDRSDREARRALRNELGFAESDYVIGILAVLRPEKNHVQLVDAAAALQVRGIAARVLMIGDGEMRSTIEARALSLKGERNVAITGFQQDVRPYISACDVVVLCSVAVETFSLAALEAMAMGRPVIHSDIGGASEMIVPGRNGFLFPAGDTKALVDKLAVLSDRAVAERMGHEARAMVTARFSERMMVDRYEQTLLELCGAGRSDRAISRPTSALDES